MDGMTPTTGVQGNGHRTLTRLMTEQEAEEIQRLEEARRLAWAKFYREERRATDAENQWGLWEDRAMQAEHVIEDVKVYLGALSLLVEMGEISVVLCMLSRRLMLMCAEVRDVWASCSPDDYEDATYCLADQMIALATGGAEARA